MKQIYCPWGWGDICCASTILPFIEDYVYWWINPKWAWLFDEHEQVETRCMKTDMLVNEKNLFDDGTIFPQPWLNKGLLSQAPYVHIPQLVLLGEVRNKNPRPQVKHRTDEWEQSPDKPVAIIERTAISFGSLTREDTDKIVTLLPEHEIVWGDEIPLRQIFDAYHKSDIFIGIASGISCYTCSCLQPPRRRIEYTGGDHISCRHMEPATQTTTSKDRFFELIKEAGKV